MTLQCLEDSALKLSLGLIAGFRVGLGRNF